MRWMSVEAQLCTLINQMETLHAAVNDLLYGLTGVRDGLPVPDTLIAAAGNGTTAGDVVLGTNGVAHHHALPAAGGAPSIGVFMHPPFSAAVTGPSDSSSPWLVRTTEDGRSRMHSRWHMPVVFSTHAMGGAAGGNMSETTMAKATYAEELFDAQHPKNMKHALDNFTD